MTFSSRCTLCFIALLGLPGEVVGDGDFFGVDVLGEDGADGVELRLCVEEGAAGIVESRMMLAFIVL